MIDLCAPGVKILHYFDQTEPKQKQKQSTKPDAQTMVCAKNSEETLLELNKQLYRSDKSTR